MTERAAKATVNFILEYLFDNVDILNYDNVVRNDQSKESQKEATDAHCGLVRYIRTRWIVRGNIRTRLSILVTARIAAYHDPAFCAHVFDDINGSGINFS